MPRPPPPPRPRNQTHPPPARRRDAGRPSAEEIVRIEAVCGDIAVMRVQQQQALLDAVAAALASVKGWGDAKL